MSTHVEVIAAYGRQYDTLEAARADWNAGKDFRLTTGPYVSKSEAERHGLSVTVRYGRGKVGTLR